MKTNLANLEISEYTCFQDDMASCFFVDSKNKYFGFYYGGYIQFLCPFENLINFNINNSGVEMSYKNKRVYGAGFGLDGIESVGVGSYVIPKLNKPSTYYLILSYFDSQATVHEFKLTLYCTFKKHDIYSCGEKEVELRDNLHCSFTAEKMSEIASKLNTCKTLGEQILNKEISAENFNIELVKQE